MVEKQGYKFLYSSRYGDHLLSPHASRKPGISIERMNVIGFGSSARPMDAVAMRILHELIHLHLDLSASASPVVVG